MQTFLQDETVNKNYKYQNGTRAQISFHPQKMLEFKVVVLGDSETGKTCLAKRYCIGRPLKSQELDTENTIGLDIFEKILKINDQEIKMYIWDTAGTERYNIGMSEHYYRNVNAAVFVYDTTSMESLQKLEYWIKALYDRLKSSTTNNNVPSIVVGNKNDLASQRRIPKNYAQKFADKYQMVLFETSAKDDLQANIDALFETLAHKLCTITSNERNISFMNSAVLNLDSIKVETPKKNSCFC